jgi:uncharacterized protein CbrC (UPF0167 family)
VSELGRASNRPIGSWRAGGIFHGVMELPTFLYHPDPVATRSVIASGSACVVCGQAPGYIYVGPVYAIEEYVNEICPACIADGSAADTLNATFNDDIVNYDGPGDVPDSVIETIVRCTPGFEGWQQEEWLYHCADGAVFLGRMGARELAGYPDVVQEMRELYADPHRDIEGFIAALDRDDPPSAYLFRCRHCDRYLFYTDTT